MPIYEFVCNKCGNIFDFMVLKSSDPEPVCPECGSADLKKLVSAGFVRADGIPSGSGGFAAKCSGKCKI